MSTAQKHVYTNPYLLLTLTVLFWSSNMVIGRSIRGDVPPVTLAFWRWVVALGLVLPLALPHLKAQWPLLRAGWRPLLALGLLGTAGYNSFAYVGLQHTTATNAALLNSFVPIATIAISWAFLGKHLRPRESLGVAISLCGALTIVGRGDPALLAGLQLNAGDLWILLAVLDWAMYTVALAWRPAGLHPMLMLAASIVVGLLALGPGSLLELSGGRTVNINATSLATIAYLGLLPSFLGYIFYNRAVAEVGASKASLFIHLMPVFGTLLSAIFLGEVALWYHYLGITLIFTGIWLTTRK
jgi:drug/metabolite transporter (DMT)-like permease